MKKLQSINVQYSINSGWKTYGPTNTDCYLKIHSNYMYIDNNKNWFQDFLKRIQPSLTLASPFPIIITRENTNNIRLQGSVKTRLVFHSQDSKAIPFTNTLTIKHLDYKGENGLTIDISFLNLQNSELNVISDWFNSFN